MYVFFNENIYIYNVYEKKENQQHTRAAYLNINFIRSHIAPRMKNKYDDDVEYIFRGVFFLLLFLLCRREEKGGNQLIFFFSLFLSAHES